MIEVAQLTNEVEADRQIESVAVRAAILTALGLILESSSDDRSMFFASGNKEAFREAIIPAVMVARMSGKYRALYEWSRATGYSLPPLPDSTAGVMSRASWLVSSLNVGRDELIHQRAQAVLITDNLANEIFTRVADKLDGNLSASRNEVRLALEKSGFGRINNYQVVEWSEAIGYSQYERGRDEGYDIPSVATQLWGYRWSSILDSRTTQGCYSLDGWIDVADDEWINLLKPPRHFKCRSVLIPVWQISGASMPRRVPPRVSESQLAVFLSEKRRFLNYIKAA